MQFEFEVAKRPWAWVFLRICETSPSTRKVPWCGHSLTVASLPHEEMLAVGRQGRRPVWRCAALPRMGRQPFGRALPIGGGAYRGRGRAVGPAGTHRHCRRRAGRRRRHRARGEIPSRRPDIRRLGFEQRERRSGVRRAGSRLGARLSDRESRHRQADAVAPRSRPRPRAPAPAEPDRRGLSRHRPPTTAAGKPDGRQRIRGPRRRSRVSFDPRPADQDRRRTDRGSRGARQPDV